MTLHYIAYIHTSIHTYINYITLQYITFHYIHTLHTSHYINYITLHYITLHFISFHFITYIHYIHHITLITLPYITLHYIALHYITLHYITLHTYTHTHIFMLAEFLPSSQTHKFWHDKHTVALCTHGVGWGGAITSNCTCTHMSCYASARSSHCCVVHRWGGVGWVGAIIILTSNCTCTHTCHATLLHVLLTVAHTHTRVILRSFQWQWETQRDLLKTTAMYIKQLS